MFLRSIDAFARVKDANLLFEILDEIVEGWRWPILFRSS